MKQIIEDAVKMVKSKYRARQARLQTLESCVISGSATSFEDLQEK